MAYREATIHVALPSVAYRVTIIIVVSTFPVWKFCGHPGSCKQPLIHSYMCREIHSKGWGPGLNKNGKVRRAAEFICVLTADSM